MEDRLLDKIAEPFNINLPEYQSMEEMIDSILPVVKKYSEPSLEEDDAPIYKVNWIKMSDQPGYNTVSLHSFNASSGEISIANDGAMDSSSFRIINPKRIVIGASMYRDSFLYELSFMDNDFLIFKQHGNPANIRTKYLFYCSEPIGTRLTWDEALEKLVGKYRDNQMPWVLILIIAALVIAAIVYLR
jgi:hypothetical protein